MTTFLDGLNDNFSNYGGLLSAGTLWQQTATTNASRDAADATKRLSKDIAANTAAQKKALAELSKDLAESTEVQKQALAEMQDMTDLQRQTLMAQQQQFALQQQQVKMQQQQLQTEQREKKRAAEFRKLLAFTKHLIAEFDES
tara:strand:- start:174 stop:602 length:429 start_codon:yes stop_codon:yes gene_type:complete